MKLNALSNQAPVVTGPIGIDLDVTARLGPAVNQHINALEALCKLTPNCDEILAKLGDLRASFASCVPMGTNVLETGLNDGEIDVVSVLEMFESLEPALGDKAWVVVSKKLREEGRTQRSIAEAIDRAIILKA